jgi:hypothetical protein
MEPQMDEILPYIWRKNYQNRGALPEKVLEIAHEQAREYLSRAVAQPSGLTRQRWRRGGRLTRS